MNFSQSATELLLERSSSDQQTPTLNVTKLLSGWRRIRAIAVRQLNNVLFVSGHFVDAIDLSGLDAFAAFPRAWTVLGHVPSGRTRLVVARSRYVVRSDG